MNFTKLQGAGNDFVLVETSDTQRDWSPVARAICDRHFGVGGDGLLLVLPSNVADFQMRVFNPDGSGPEACGNGLRCVAKYALHKGLVNGSNQEISVETIAGIRTARLLKTEGELPTIQVGMGSPGFRADDISLIVGSGKDDLVDIKPILDYPVTVNGEELPMSFISIGNPHAVYFYPHSIPDFPLSRIGPEVEQHELFPHRVNFEVARVINRQQIEARVWERGVGETMACGSGACAVAVLAQLHGYVDNRVDIKLPGGILEVDWNGAGEIFLSGPAEIVFTGEWQD
jgi:diaminopimelate epimerase